MNAQDAITTASWYYNDDTGLVVYFRKRFNRKYDAHDILTDKRIKKFRNLSIEKVMEMFKPYEPPRMSNPVAQHLDESINDFQNTLASIDEPQDLELHNHIKRTLHSTRRNCHDYLHGAE